MRTLLWSVVGVLLLTIIVGAAAESFVIDVWHQHLNAPPLDKYNPLSPAWNHKTPSPVTHP